MNAGLTVRALTEADAGNFQAVRLRALAEHPEAYGTSVEEEAHIPIVRIEERFADPSPENRTFGAFMDQQIVGTVAISRYSRIKTRHRAIISTMYVTPEARRQGVGRVLLEAAVAHGKTLEGLEEIILAVTVGNDGARTLYISAGFVPYSIEPRYLKVGDTHYDIEWMTLRF